MEKLIISNEDELRLEINMMIEMLKTCTNDQTTLVMLEELKSCTNMVKHYSLLIKILKRINLGGKE
jgi:hypothetical protein